MVDMKEDKVITVPLYVPTGKEKKVCAVPGCKDKPRHTCCVCKLKFCALHWVTHFHLDKPKKGRKHEVSG